MWMIKYVRFAESAFLGLICRAFLGVESHPVGVRGLKLNGAAHGRMSIRSHPVGVRGLKRAAGRMRDAVFLFVAPRRGAWIETKLPLVDTPKKLKSHPVGVRGLKPSCAAALCVPTWSHPVGVRGLKQSGSLARSSIVKSHPVGVRGLKLRTAAIPLLTTCPGGRTP